MEKELLDVTVVIAFNEEGITKSKVFQIDVAGKDYHKLLQALDNVGIEIYTLEPRETTHKEINNG